MISMTEWYPWLFALAIFFARVVDVTLGTIRTLMVFRGRRMLAATIGFAESIIWIFAIGSVVTQLDQWYYAVCYAAGFAAGNYLGIALEARLAIGKEMLRVVSYRTDVALGDIIRSAQVRVIELDGRRREGEPVQVLLIILPRRRVPEIVELVKTNDPEALFTISDVKESSHDDVLVPQIPVAPSGWRLRGLRK